MLTFFQLSNRLFYRAVNGGTGVDVRLMFIDPNLSKTENIPFDELFDGYYFLDHTFELQGKYVLEITEDGEFKVSTTMSIHLNMSGTVRYLDALT